MENTAELETIQIDGKTYEYDPDDHSSVAKVFPRMAPMRQRLTLCRLVHNKFASYEHLFKDKIPNLKELIVE